MQAVSIFKKKSAFYFGKGCALSVAFHLTLLTCFIIIEKRGLFFKDYSDLKDVKSVHYIEITNFNQTSSAPIVEHKSDDLQIAGTLDITKQIGYKEQTNQQVVQEVEKVQSTTELKQIEKIEKEKIIKTAKKGLRKFDV